jgi:TRAP-type C4-dicarboxylate transport system permease small subunit
LDSIERYISIAVLALMLIVVFWQVFVRFVLNNANSWSEEMARFLNVLLVYVSCAYAVRFKDHIQIDVMIKVFPAVIRPFLTYLGQVLVLIFFIFLTVKGFELAVSVAAVDRTTPGLGINAGYMYFVAPIGFTFSSIRMIENWIEDCVRKIRSKKNPELISKGGVSE